MRILSVRFRNLNSLAGAWHIDFTHPEYAASGIFAITGPTGAGKSTILDAICLALYGRTPRLDKVTKSSNEIMTRGTGECSAEVEFAAGAQRYRCTWSQHRARARHTGELQQPRHELSDASTGEVLENKIALVAERIVEATGMDFTRFTRSMLLAQGSFAAFLDAPPDERAPILEQITGTEIYSRIGMLVHERRREEDLKLSALTLELDALVALSDEDEQALRTRASEVDADLAVAEARAKELGALIDWLDTIERLTREAAERDADLVAAEASHAAQAGDRARLAAARQALELEGVWRDVEVRRSAVQRAGDEHTAAVALLPARTAEATRAAVAVDVAVQADAAAREAREQARPIFTRVRALDATLAALDARIRDAAQVLARDLRVARTARDAWVEAMRKIFPDRSAARGASAAQAKGTRGDASDVREETSAFAVELERTIAAARPMLEERQVQLEREIPLDAARLELLVREEELLQRTVLFEKRIDDLEQLRAELERDAPCPLCGSTTHPFVDHDIPRQPGAIEDLARAARAVQELRASLESARTAQSGIASARAQMDALEEQRAELQRAHADLLDLDVTSTTARGERAELFGARVVDDEESLLARQADDASAALTAARATHAAAESARDSVARDLARLEAELASARTALADAVSVFTTRLQDAGFASESAFTAARMPEQERRRLDAEVSAVELALGTAGTRARDAHTRLAAERASARTDATREILMNEQTTLGTRMGALREELTRARIALADQERVRTQRQKLDDDIAAQRRTYARWDALHSLIGSADGKRYRVFVQSLTFELMIGHANRRLREMTDRYVLVQGTTSGLELDVIDAWQGGERRSTRNLSGGESFIVSLALALGLARMAGRRVRVESLFLDEGFGTLDDEALDTALQTLAGLHQDGTLIGVISHVGALKERISTQIQVARLTGGRSALVGPGITKES
jgi:DNA repair protein SbcC/Rad50